MLNYANEEVRVKGCLGCAFAKHQFKLPCGIAYENEKFIVSQDWELPIVGFFIVSPKKHIEKLEELTAIERNEMFDIVDKIIKILRKNNICERFNVIFEEKKNKHFHTWILPRYEWMYKENNNIIDNIGAIRDYAIKNFKVKEIFEDIRKVTNVVKDEFDVL